MKTKVSLLLLLFGGIAWPQQPQPVPPDCVVNINLTAAGSAPSTAGFSNVAVGCDTWTLVYTSTGFTGLTLTFESAPTGPLTAGTFGTYTGTTVKGSNPLTATDQGIATFTNLGMSPVATPWVRVTLSGLTGSGRVSGVLYGYKTGYTAGNGGGGGGGGGTPAPPQYSVQFNDPLGTFAGSAVFVENSTALPVPAAPAITNGGMPGMTMYGYEVVAGLIGATPVGLGSAPSTEGQTTTGNATLDAMNFNIVTPPACTGGLAGVTSFDIYRTTGGATQGLIGNVACGMALNDTGLAVIRPFTYTPPDSSVGIASSIPYVNTSGGSAFGCKAFANTDNPFYFPNSGTGLSVIGATSCPITSFDYNLTLDQLIVDTDTPNLAVARSSEVGLEHDVSGTSYTIAINAGLYDNGFTTHGDFYVLEPLLQMSGARVAGTIAAGVACAPSFSGSFAGSDSRSGAACVWDQPQLFGASISRLSGFWENTPAGGGGTITDYYVFGSSDQAGSATNMYYEWYDSRGVRRVREDNTFNTVGQAIEAEYNPQFTKYTPAAANFERGVLGQWESDVFWVTTEAGGTGTLRNIQIDGAEVDLGTASHLVNVPSLSALLPVLTNTGKYLVSGSLHGNTTRLQTSDNTGTNGDLAKFDINGNVTDGPALSGIALTANPLSQFASTTSAQLRGILSDESGSGVAIFAGSPLVEAPILRATSSTLSGAITIGTCNTTTVSVTGATTAMDVVVTPVSNPDSGSAGLVRWDGYVSSANTVTVRECGLGVVTPNATAYNVAVIQ